MMLQVVEAMKAEVIYRIIPKTSVKLKTEVILKVEVRVKAEVKLNNRGHNEK